MSKYHRCETPGCNLLALNDQHCVAHRDYPKPKPAKPKKQRIGQAKKDMTDDEVLTNLVKFQRLHAVSPTTHTDLMVLVMRSEAKLRGLVA